MTVAREGKFTLPAEVPELVVVLPDALVFVERYPETGSFDPPRGVCAGRCCHLLTGNAARSGR